MACSWNASRVSSSTSLSSSAARSMSAARDRAPTADAVVGQAGGFDIGRVVQVAAVEHHGIAQRRLQRCEIRAAELDRKSTRLNSSHVKISYAVFCLKKKQIITEH